MAFSGASSRQPCLRLPHYRLRLRAAASIPAAAFPQSLPFPGNSLFGKFKYTKQLFDLSLSAKKKEVDKNTFQ
jgi:hypothetical protein